ncbi:MAG TPA: ABC transporter substrate-binding protein [Fervidobacterium sp.]|nr:ABC transporter substrate-binding protein [Fervidobacterium sp.]
MTEEVHGMKKILMVLSVVLLVVTSFAADKTLQVWAMGEEAKKLDVMAQKFMKENPGVNVEIQAIPWGSAYDKLVTGIAGNQLPDLAQMGTTWMAPFGSMGAFEELTPYLKKSTVVKQDIFFPGSWETCKLDNGVYGIPWYVDTRVMFYRTDILKQVGFDKAPQTWDELYAAAKKLAARGKGMYAVSLLYTGVFGNEFMPFVWQAGADLFDSKGNITVTDPKFVQAMEYYAKFFWEGLAPMTNEDLFQAFSSGTIPIFFSGPWMVTMLNEQAPNIKGKWAVAMMPKNKTRDSFVGGSNLVIFKSSKNKDLAWKFIEFLSKPENQLQWYKTVSSLPAVKSAWNYPEIAKDPMIKVFGDQMEEARATPNIPQWEEIANAISARMQEVIYQKTTPQKAAEALKNDIQKIMSR